MRLSDITCPIASQLLGHELLELLVPTTPAILEHGGLTERCVPAAPGCCPALQPHKPPQRWEWCCIRMQWCSTVLGPKMYQD